MAEILEGREYGNVMTHDEIINAKNNNLVVSYGNSDDVLVFKGAKNGEFDAYDGTTVYLVKENRKYNVVGRSDLKSLQSAADRLGIKWAPDPKKIEAIWSPAGSDLSWEIVTDIPHANFTIFEDGTPFCKGIVFQFPSID